ncbi:DUF2164 domain-containing protein [Lentilitoribacter sp. EG35]|jgi:uncharacterized protein (DUF2164 family)|uniref:DUF2164 domain-containing protein n=1 Tax=Lentilitoribacter sp. EG35 TaxID=3234192 RepID=UPI003461510E
MRIKLNDDRKADIARALSGFFQDEFDEDLSEFRALEVVDFMLRQIGPSQYNQAIADARGFLAEKLDDLDTEFHEPEER